jgi:hypothetical protein
MLPKRDVTVTFYRQIPPLCKTHNDPNVLIPPPAAGLAMSIFALTSTVPSPALIMPM